MKKFSSIAILLCWCSLIWAEDQDLFQEGAFPEIEMVGPEFEDDFMMIERAHGDSITASSTIFDNHSLFSAQGLERRETSLSIATGNETIASAYHFTLFPQGRFVYGPMFSHLGLQLHFPVYDNVDRKNQGFRSRGFVGAESLITPRSQDFRSAWDVQRVIRHLEVGGEQDGYLFRMSRNHALTLGNGEMVRRLSPDGLYDQDVLFVSGHKSFQHALLSGFLAPFFRFEMLGLSVRSIPFSTLDTHAAIQNINLDLTYVADFDAPNLAHKDDGPFLLDKERRLVKRESGSAQGFVLGASSEYYPAPFISLKPYLSFGNLWLTGLQDTESELSSGHGAGLHFGNDSTFFLIPGTKKSIIYSKAEGRLFSSQYWPGYFGTTYLLDRVVLNEPTNDKISADPITKSQYLKDKTDGYARFGYLFELGYTYEDFFDALLSYENARSLEKGLQVPPLRKLHFMSSLIGLELLKFQVSFQATSIYQLDELFDFDKSRALLSLRGQAKLMPFLYFDTWVKHSFGINDRYLRSGTGGSNGEPVWLSHNAETRSLNFGLGLELAMTF